MPILESLDVVIAFSMVLLILSLIVTALVQAAVHVFSLRARSLQWGLERLLTTALQRKRHKARKAARRVLEDARGLTRSEGLPPGWVARFLNPVTTWIKPEEVAGRLRNAGVKHIDDEDALKQQFESMEDELSNRFAYRARLWAIVFAFLVAFGFQLSTPGLLRKLSDDPAMREKLVGEAQSLRQQAEEIIDAVPSYESVSAEALDQLAEAHPEIAEQLEEVSGMGADREDVVDEMRDVLGDVLGDESPDVVAEYEQLLDDLHAKEVEESLGDVDELATQLAAVDITFWPEGIAFYGDFRHWIGVLMTTILLAFGAPFWFDTLGRLLQLKDFLNPASRKGKQKQPATT